MGLLLGRLELGGRELLVRVRVRIRVRVRVSDEGLENTSDA